MLRSIHYGTIKKNRANLYELKSINHIRTSPVQRHHSGTSEDFTSPINAIPFLKQALRQDNQSEVENILGGLRKQGTPIRGEILCLLFVNSVHKRRYEETQQYLIQMKETSSFPDFENCKVLEVCFNKGDPEIALLLFEQLKTWVILPRSVYYRFIQYFIRERDISKAEKAFQESLDFYNPTLKILNKFLALYSKFELWEKMQSIFQMIHEHFPNEEINVEYYNNLIEIGIRVADIASIEESYQLLIKNGLNPNSYTLGILLKFYLERGKILFAEKYLRIHCQLFPQMDIPQKLKIMFFDIYRKMGKQIPDEFKHKLEYHVGQEISNSDKYKIWKSNSTKYK